MHDAGAYFRQLKDKNIKLIGADAATRGGFTQVPNFILTHTKLSVGAKLTYAALLMYSWQNDYCFPGQATLAEDIGSTDRSVRTYIKELEREGFLTVKKRGLGKTNIYELSLKPKRR